ncbi:MAG: HU family DNA-binding protein [Clostridia bacterium]|nr:HU family DNA-binding protein [Clostridia bacterium]
MNKTELVTAVAENADISRKDAEAAINAFTDVVVDALKNRDKVQMVGFGTFECRERPARKGINPRTREEIEIAETVVPHFKAGKALKDAIK